MRNEDLKLARNTKILERYNQMYWGEMKRDSVIFPELTREFYLAETTLKDIIWRMGKSVPQTLEL